MDLNFLTEDATLGDKRLHYAVVELANAVVALFWEGDEPRLGTLTATLPHTVSSTLLGERNILLGQLLGEHLSSIYGKLVLVSTNFSMSTGMDVGRDLIAMVRKLAGCSTNIGKIK